MNKRMIVGLVLLWILVGWHIIELYSHQRAISELKEELEALTERQSVTWYRQMVFEGRVRGLENQTVVVVGHPDTERGYFVTIEAMDEYMGVGPYDANTYVNVAVDVPLEIFLRDREGSVVDGLVVDGLNPGDLVIVWHTDQTVEDTTSPDDWKLPASYSSGEGLIVAIEHFSGRTE